MPRDQTQPGSMGAEKRDPGNEVGAQEAFPVVFSLMAKIFWVNQQGVLEKQLDPGR